MISSNTKESLGESLLVGIWTKLPSFASNLEALSGH